MTSTSTEFAAPDLMGLTTEQLEAWRRRMAELIQQGERRSSASWLAFCEVFQQTGTTSA